MSEKKSHNLKFWFGFDHAFGVKSEGLSGGLALFWNRDSVVRLNSFSRSHIDVMVTNDLTCDVEWRFTGFYGEPVRSRRNRSWELLKFFRREFDNPWLCAGDFNEVLCSSEQFGGNEREDWKMGGFIDTFEECRFSDLGYSGLPTHGTIDNKMIVI